MGKTWGINSIRGVRRADDVRRANTAKRTNSFGFIQRRSGVIRWHDHGTLIPFNDGLKARQPAERVDVHQFLAIGFTGTSPESQRWTVIG
ncbi:hypothetical protein O9992_19390 [Vibrio lentus]|nr:hypothetical protein [Vibrio lentus]